mmetsp:Transcript_57633/g.115747  ORF Transcript_57633/g.115747 Transcript_57633/m.115747 type:complete len:424 (-) Transcript_57633:102-1373(-)
MAEYTASSLPVLPEASAACPETEALVACTARLDASLRDSSSEDVSSGGGTSGSDDGDSGEDSAFTPGSPPDGFEGPEKNLEVLFVKGKGHPRGCRALDRAALDKICEAASCTILTSTSNGHLDAYVLSESSLFVYSYKMMLKTCGRTTLLRCLLPLLRLASDLGLELEWLSYSRKNYTFPNDQVFPHSSFQEEFGYLKKHPQLEKRLGGSGYVLGPITGDHWFVYVSDKSLESTAVTTDRTLNVMMFDLDPAVASLFYKANSADAKTMTSKSGIAALVPGAVIDDCAFEPCGYSMNAILYGSYSTVHITPEPECSYASFETNTTLTSYTALIKNVLSVFRPGRVVVTMMADAAGLKQMVDSPFSENNPPAFGKYVRSSSSFTMVEGDCCMQMGNWEIPREGKSPRAPLQHPRAHRKANRATSF